MTGSSSFSSGIMATWLFRLLSILSVFSFNSDSVLLILSCKALRSNSPSFCDPSFVLRVFSSSWTCRLISTIIVSHLSKWKIEIRSEIFLLWAKDHRFLCCRAHCWTALELLTYSYYILRHENKIGQFRYFILNLKHTFSFFDFWCLRMFYIKYLFQTVFFLLLYYGIYFLSPEKIQFNKRIRIISQIHSVFMKIMCFAWQRIIS